MCSKKQYNTYGGIYKMTGYFLTFVGIMGMLYGGFIGFTITFAVFCYLLRLTVITRRLKGFKRTARPNYTVRYYK